MELVQKLMKKTTKYLFYSHLTEKVLTECPCSCLHRQWFIPHRLSESIDINIEELYWGTLGGGHANMEQLVRGTLSCGTQRGDDRVDAANISTYLHNTQYLLIYISTYLQVW